MVCNENQEINETVTAFERRVKIWQKIRLIFDNKEQIQIIDIDNLKPRRELLNRLTGSEPIDKNAFNTSLLTVEMLTKFVELIQQITHTWTTNLIQKYLFDIPRELEALQLSIQEKIKYKTVLIKECEDYRSYIDQLTDQLKGLQIQIKEFKHKKKLFNKKAISGEEFELFLNLPQYNAEKINQKGIDIQRKYCNDLKNELFNQKMNKKKLIEDLEAAETADKEIDIKINDLLESIRVMMKGNHTEILKEYKPNPNKKKEVN